MGCVLLDLGFRLASGRSKKKKRNRFGQPHDAHFATLVLARGSHRVKFSSIFRTYVRWI